MSYFAEAQFVIDALGKQIDKSLGGGFSSC